MTKKSSPGASDFKPQYAACPSCGEMFFKDLVWKVTCLECYLDKKHRRELQTPTAATPIEPGMLRRLIQLCHPDRHSNSEASNTVSAGAEIGAVSSTAFNNF